jgi:Protein of unknown function (DUF3306)
MSNDRDNGPFFSRWSRQKQQQAREPEAKRKPTVPAKPEEPEPEVDLSKLPKLEDLTAETDITGFLQKGVPEALQKLALRKMWSLDPGIRDFVEVAENQWDFNMPGGIYGLYQDVEKGTDISVWMAQATQSVFGEDAKKLADAEAKRDAEQDVVAEAHAGAVAEQHGPSEAKPPLELAAAVQAVAAESVAPVAPSPTASRSEPRSEPTASRRRHGGALPT